MTSYDAPALIELKRDGFSLDQSQIDWLVSGFTSGAVAPEQMSAFTMAVFFQGMTAPEISWFTKAMIGTGKTFDFRDLDRPSVDKHSTGGVGDKITLPLVPLVASFGAAVPQLSGRALGHTGGTLDKLEAIPGWRADLSESEIRAQLEGVGAVICAAGPGLVPADKKLYALRDITATVESLALLASSIMSKKIAEGTGALVLDVKFGDGAFLTDYDRASALAETMVDLGNSAGVNTRAMLNDMSTPLGLTVGNANEVRESLEVLAGGGPKDVVDLTVALAEEMLDAAGITGVAASENLKNGRAMDVWRKMIAAQGGEVDAPLPTARHQHTVYAAADGVLETVSARAFGNAARVLGAGRAKPSDLVQKAAGIDLHRVQGDRVKRGDALFTLMSDDEERISRGEELALAGIRLSS